MLAPAQPGPSHKGADVGSDDLGTPMTGVFKRLTGVLENPPTSYRALFQQQHCWLQLSRTLLLCLWSIFLLSRMFKSSIYASGC